MRKISVFYFISYIFCECGCVYECVSREARFGCPDFTHHLVFVGQGLSLNLVLGWQLSSSRILLSLSLLLFTELESNKKKRSHKKLEGKLVEDRDKRVTDKKQMG